MKKITLPGFIILVFAVLISACQFKPYELTDNGVLVRIRHKNGSEETRLKIDVVTDKIIHVKAINGKSFSSRESLMAVKDTLTPPKFSCTKEGEEVLLKTSALLVKVSLTTGEVRYFNESGKEILAEKKGGGKSFEEVTFDNDKGYSVRQEFESPADEAIYGLGENQTNFLNLKGKDADLFQYNTVAVVPFIVSSRNYGILWDNNGRTKFGDVREFEEISSLKLYNKSGNPGSLTATYKLKADTSKTIISRDEKELSYQFLHDMKKFPAGVVLGDGLINWEGSIEADTTGEHKFLFVSAGYAKLWIDGKLLFDRWRQCWNPVTTRFSYPMEAGKKYNLKIEWIPDGNESFITLKHLSPLNPEEQGRISFFSEMADQIDYYFMAGSNMDEVIHHYRTITGKAPIMPKWAMGFWQSRERYKTQDEILETMREYRKRNIPIDNIVEDWFYWKEDKWGDHEFDPSRFPNPEQMIKTLHDSLNAHFMISVWPKFYVGTENYKKMDEQGWLYKKNIENNQKDWVGYVSTFYDAFNEDARKAYWEDMNKKLFSKGVDAWWMDATEPDVLSNMSLRERQELMNPTALGSAARNFNAFPLVHAGGVYEGQRTANPDQRVFILTRSGFAGSQRYAASTWSGDIAASWVDMKGQIPAGLSFSISGIPYWTMDIGGFAVETRYMDAKGETLEEWREQMCRWYQFGAFCPLFRAHGQFPFREIYNVAPEGHPAYEGILDVDKLRYRLMPYIYTLAAESYFNDYTMMRPLIMDFPTDSKVTNIADQFMFGPSLLINPVCEYKSRSREVYLPEGCGWYDLYSGKYFKGGAVINAVAPISHIPVFVKEGTILPVGPEIQYASENPSGAVTICVFPGMNGQFTLYEDEGTNYQYEKGAFSRIQFSYDEASRQLTINKREGSFPGMPANRVFNIVLVDRNKPFSIGKEVLSAKTVQYDGAVQKIQL
ncbi:MAG: DUF5110 domain-containing protein [Bacteroidales bacterium]|nr:DUF5110 domain-containing protein [Bacteroidales bacterium]